MVKALGDRFKAQPGEIVERVAALQEELRATQKALAAARQELALARSAALAAQAEGRGRGGGRRALPAAGGPPRRCGGRGPAERRPGAGGSAGDTAAVVLGGLPDPADLGKVILVAAFGKAVIAQGQQAGRFIGGVAKACGGGGGGRPNLAQAGGRDGAALEGALEQARQELRTPWAEPQASRGAARKAAIPPMALSAPSRTLTWPLRTSGATRLSPAAPVPGAPPGACFRPRPPSGVLRRFWKPGRLPPARIAPSPVIGSPPTPGPRPVVPAGSGAAEAPGTRSSPVRPLPRCPAAPAP